MTDMQSKREPTVKDLEDWLHYIPATPTGAYLDWMLNTLTGLWEESDKDEKGC